MTSIGILKAQFAQFPEFQKAMETAFDKDKSYQLKEFDIFKINTFSDWLAFIERMLTWRPSENEGGSYVYMSLCLFYIIIDEMDPKSPWAQSPIVPQTIPSDYTWLTSWIIGYAKEIGTWMDSPDSLDKELLKTFYNAPRYHMQDYEPWPGTFTTFNEFFRRPIKREVRPIASPDNQLVITNPADCTFSGSWPVDQNGTVTFKSVPWPIWQLLDDSLKDSHKNEFAGGCFAHSYLNTTDYHRQHAPCDGEVIEAKVIEGIAYLQVKVVTDAEGKPTLEMRRKPYPTGSNDVVMPDEPGYQFLQTRGLVLIKNPVLGLVACMPIGMAQVNSVVLSVKKGDYLTKGQEISFFKFGGSDIVLVFQEQAKVQFTAHQNQWNPFGKQIAVCGAPVPSN